MEFLCDFCNPQTPPGRETGYPTPDGLEHHPGQCREVETPWQVIECTEEREDWDPDQDYNPYGLAGFTTLETVIEPEGHTFPADTPGYRRLSDSSVEAIVVYIRGGVPEDVTPAHFDSSAEDDMSWDSSPKSYWEIVYMVRPATQAEAEGYLADQGAY